MNTINYNVLSGETLNVGRQYEHHKSKVVFSGYEPVNAANEIYLKWEGADSYLIPMVNFTFDVVQPLTKKSGMAICQIEEMGGSNAAFSIAERG